MCFYCQSLNDVKYNILMEVKEITLVMELFDVFKSDPVKRNLKITIQNTRI